MKEAYYFSHDSNANKDPKILQMRSVYGLEGYGMYWVIIEMLREQSDYKLSLRGQYIWNAFAMQLQCEPEKARKFIEDCIGEFKLFDTDGDYFWSNSLLKRMAEKEEKSEKARQSALKRWGKNNNTNALQTHSECNAIKERKVKERKDIGGSINSTVGKKEGATKKAATADNSLKIIADALNKAGILMPSPFEIENLSAWHEEGMELEAVVYAIQKAALAGQRKVSYVNGILKGWARQGIKTLAHVEAADIEFERNKAGNGQLPASSSNTPRGPTEEDVCSTVTYIKYSLKEFQTENPGYSDQDLKTFLNSPQFDYDPPELKAKAFERLDLTQYLERGP